MAIAPAPFSDIGKQVKDLLTKDYNFDQKFTFSVPSSSGMGLTTTGVQRNHLFIGDIRTQYKSGNTTVDAKFDSYYNMHAKVTVEDILASTKASLSFDIPDHKSGKLDVHYLCNHMFIASSIGLHPTPLLEVAATVGNKDLCYGGEFEFDTTSSSFTKYNAGIEFNKADFSAALILMDKGKALKWSYIHTMGANAVAAEMTHKFSLYENNFTLGTSHLIDPCTLIKTRFSTNGTVSMLYQREWRPRSFVTFSAEYNSMAINAAPKVGLAIALQP